MFFIVKLMILGINKGRSDLYTLPVCQTGVEMDNLSLAQELS